MLYRPLIALALCALPFSIVAETTLYACTSKGHTTLESTPSKDCDTLQTYQYPTYDKKDQNAKDKPAQTSGLRPEEVRRLEALEFSPVNGQSLTRRFENVDERVGWSLSHEYIDSRQDKCSFYLALLDQSLSYIGVKAEQDIEIGPTDSARLGANIRYAQDQVNYYCR